MPLELDHVLNLGLHGKMIVLLVKVPAAALRRHALDLIRRVDAALRLCQNLDIEIGCKDAVARPRRHLLHDDRKRIRLCPDGAACTPYIEL